MKRVLLFPTELEAAPLRALRPDLEVCICGVGAIETARTVARLLAESAPEQLVLCGIAGCYDQSLAIGEVVEVESEHTASLPKVFRAQYRATMSLGLRSVVSNTVMSVGEAKESEAEIENMEGAALFALCEGTACVCGEIRAISNRVDAPREEWDIDSALQNLTQTIDRLFPH